MAGFSRRDFLTVAGLMAGEGQELFSFDRKDGSTQEPGEDEWRPALAGDPRDLPSRDRRLEVHSTNTTYAVPRFTSRHEWQRRAVALREQVLSAAGLWPFPERTPLQPKIFDRIEESGYSVEKVYFESYPDFFCTGNLYRPSDSNRKPPFPGVLSPHGHFTYGRLEHCPGDGGVVSVPQRCMNFALQGYIAFAYDMVGWNDSFQVSHFYGIDREAPWGLSREGLRLGLWGMSVLGLQLWNSIRALDFLLSLSDVDPERIAVTGASGGATQTILLNAVDDRVRVSAPVNMISHYMQGGDLCENAPNLRIDTNNVEIGALMAPRPMIMISATGDWTRDTPRVEYPAIASIYELFGAKDHLSEQQLPFPHNYNLASREAVYRFFARWLPKQERGKTEPAEIKEQGVFWHDPSKLLVFSRRSLPANAPDADQVMESLLTAARRQLANAFPQSMEQLSAYRKLFRPVFRSAVMVDYPPSDELRWWPNGKVSLEGGDRKKEWHHLLLGRISAGDRVPAQLVRPAKHSQAAVLLVNQNGAEAALGNAQSPSSMAQEFIKRGYLVFSIDAFQTGQALDPTRKMEGRYFSTYNRTDDVQRIQDVLMAVAYLETVWQPKKILIVGQGLAGLWCLLARPFLRVPAVVSADTAGFESEKDEAYLDHLHVPLLRRAGDFQTAALLAPSSPLMLHNLAGRFVTTGFVRAFNLQGASKDLHMSHEALIPAQISAWLARQ